MTDKPRMPDSFDDPTKEGIFRSHSCWACNDGAKPCREQPKGREYLCSIPHARND